MKPVIRLLVPLAMLALSACGGGSSSSPSSPPTTSYTIGGTLSGLLGGRTVILQVNGGDSLTLTSNGAFQFSSAIASGTVYTVAVSSQPGGLNCAVTNASSTATANISNVTVTCTSNNVASVSVGTFPSDVSQDDFNVPLVTVTVCSPQGTCKPFQVLVDTGSSGLRLMGSSLSAAGLTLPKEADPANASNSFYECAYYADGYAWGSVNTATVEILAANGTVAETTADIPVQVITASNPTVPTSCINGSPGGPTNLNTPDSFSADGVLGVGIGAQDCGSACVSSPLYYFSCSSTLGCLANATATTVSLQSQVINPVTAFGADNNGSAIQFPAIPASGALSATGTLTFGVGTQADNALGGAVVLPITAANLSQSPMYISTNFQGTAEDGIIDSGSNALYFADSSLAASLCMQTSASFYCPTTTQNLTATNSSGATSSQVSFSIANLDDLHSANPTFYAFDDVGGPLAEINGVSYFDFGLPFFFNRTVFTIIEGSSVGGTSYAQGAFAY